MSNFIPVLWPTLEHLEATASSSSSFRRLQVLDRAPSFYSLCTARSSPSHPHAEPDVNMKKNRVTNITVSVLENKAKISWRYVIDLRKVLAKFFFFYKDPTRLSRNLMRIYQDLEQYILEEWLRVLIFTMEWSNLELSPNSQIEHITYIYVFI